MYRVCIKAFVLTRSLARPIRKCTSSAKIRQKCYKIGCKNYFGKWRRHDKKAMYSSVSGFRICSHMYRVTTCHSPSPSPHQPRRFTRQIRHFIGHQQMIDSSSLPNSSRLETRNRHPGVPTLIISDWSFTDF